MLLSEKLVALDLLINDIKDDQTRISFIKLDKNNTDGDKIIRYSSRLDFNTSKSYKTARDKLKAQYLKELETFRTKLIKQLTKGVK